MITNALSVDVEEYYHAAIFRHGTRGQGTASFESRVEQSVERLLGLLSDHFARATFFVLGEIAMHHPGIVRAIAAQGHEIACHGNGHEDVYRLTPHEFRADIRQAKMRIEDVVGDPVTRRSAGPTRFCSRRGSAMTRAPTRSSTIATASPAHRASRMKSGETDRRA
jgi:peptidoglycan/xylan/chitin deacetylase (PgdA/CDA1 family)